LEYFGCWSVLVRDFEGRRATHGLRRWPTRNPEVTHLASIRLWTNPALFSVLSLHMHYSHISERAVRHFAPFSGLPSFLQYSASHCSASSKTGQAPHTSAKACGKHGTASVQNSNNISCRQAFFLWLILVSVSFCCAPTKLTSKPAISFCFMPYLMPPL